MQKLNKSLAKEPISIQVANKCATWKLDTKDKKADLQSIVKNNCKHLSDNSQRSYCSFSLKMNCFLIASEVNGKLSRSPFNKGREYLTIAELS
jgi:hypothetical protein